MRKFPGGLGCHHVLLLAGVLCCLALLVIVPGAMILAAVFLALLSPIIYSNIKEQRRKRRARAPGVQSENAYAILGVSRWADLPAIRQAFRRLVQKYHPDAAPPEEKERAAALFIRISQAYELLSDEDKRFQYDGLLDDFEDDVPPFDEAYELFKDEDKHPSYAWYDALYGPNGQWPAEGRGEEEAGEGRESREEGEPSKAGQPASAGEAEAAPAGPTEVDVPDAVREALGLPVGLTEDGAGPALVCPRCGRAVASGDGSAECANCRR